MSRRLRRRRSLLSCVDEGGKGSAIRVGAAHLAIAVISPRDDGSVRADCHDVSVTRIGRDEGSAIRIRLARFRYFADDRDGCRCSE